MKKYSLILVCLIISLVAMSQKPVISFEEKSYDFGKVNEEDGKITHVFNFENKGNAPLVINRAQAQCGCTTPVWTTFPIEPGQKGTITVTYNPQGRPGNFTKTITVYSNAAEEQFLLTIHGEVIPKPSTDNSAYPINMNGLGAKSKVVQMNNIDKGKVQERTLNVQNLSKAAMKPTIEGLPSYLTAIVSPESLAPGQEGKITFTFDSKKCTVWGPVSDDVFVVINGTKKVTDEFRLMIVGNVIEDFGKYTLDQKRKAPILEIPERTVNLGTQAVNAKKNVGFKVKNNGQNNLEIRRIINNNKELTIKPRNASVTSGRATEIVVSLDTKGLVAGDYKRTFTVQTNDPENSFVILVVTWKVK
jgi:hypothetical protein